MVEGRMSAVPPLPLRASVLAGQKAGATLDDQKDRGRASSDKRRGDSDDNMVQHDGTP